jgi:ATP-dependent Clp protease ATP-binding subunit ClpB
LLKEQIAGIADIQLQQLSGRLAERELSLILSSEAKAKLVDLGYDPVFGARPLKRAIQRWVENPLAQAILSGEFKAGDEIIAEVEGGKLRFHGR